MRMLIRRVEEHDIDQLLILCALHAEYEKSDYHSEGKRGKLFSQLFESTNGLQCLVVEDKGQLQGYATFIKQYATWDADYYLYLDCIYLKEELRGQGIGTALMNQVRAYGEKENCIQVQWQTPTFNKRAIKFYRKLGANSREKERFFW